MTLRLARLWFSTSLLAATPVLLAQVPSPATVRPTPPLQSSSNKVLATVPQRPAPDMVDSFKVSDVDIDAILSALETYTGRTIIRPGQLPTQPYSLKISRPIPKAELVTALETILELNGVSVSPMGTRFLKVTPLSQAKSEAPEMIMGSTHDLPASGRIVTKIFELNFLRVSEFVPQILTFMTPNIGNGIVSLEKANVIMVTDSLENVQRIERLLVEVDTPRESGLEPKFYSLHNGAKASDVVQKIHTMLTGPAATSLRATTTFTPDDRTNQIILIADPREYPLFDSLIAQMDIKSDPTTRMEVMSLKHADAKDVATLLGSLISGQTTAAQKNTNSVRPGTIATPGQPATPATPGVPAATPAADTNTAATSEFSSFITVEADERTNSIVVSGTVDDIRLIRGIVEKIDVLLAEVSIQVVIAEVTLSDTDDNGLSALNLVIGKAPNGGTSIIGASGAVSGWTFGSPSSIGSPATLNPLSILASLQSAGDKHKVKILEQNTITTTHNKQAVFTVSEQEPVITGTTGVPLASTTASASFATSSQVSYKDIGITLKVTPLIGDDGWIQLTIDQTVDDDQGSVTIDGNSQPIIGHREATAYANVVDGQLAVLAGLQSSGLTTDKQKLGILYEIPIISNLLGYRTKDLERTELLLFILPHVIRPDETNGDTLKHIEGMSNKEQIKKFLTNPDAMPDATESLKEKLQN
jgi:general secretion pathway protein D